MHLPASYLHGNSIYFVYKMATDLDKAKLVKFVYETRSIVAAQRKFRHLKKLRTCLIVCKKQTLLNFYLKK